MGILLAAVTKKCRRFQNGEVPSSCACRYILPALSLIPAEAEESVRVEYAGILAQLAATAHRFLMRLQMPAASAQQQVSASIAHLGIQHQSSPY
jgi:hypothetical protein